MAQLPETPLRLHRQPWFLCLLALYALLELSFNHRLLDIAGSHLPDVSGLRLQEMEIWARVISGLGLALLWMRWLDRVIASRLILLCVSLVLGLVLIWHLQKSLVEAIIERADAHDKAMSVHAILSTGEALKGRLELRGQPVLEGPAPADMRPVMGAMWASSVLGLSPQDLEPTAGAAQLAAHWDGFSPSPDQLREAYRRVVVVPIALGASLLFGMLNICQLLAGLSAWLLQRWGPRAWYTLARRALLPAWLTLCVFWSWWPGNAWVDSPGYREVAQPALWQAKPLLAPFVAWSLRAELAWNDPVAWVHRELLGGFDFRVPQAVMTRLGP